MEDTLCFHFYRDLSASMTSYTTGNAAPTTLMSKSMHSRLGQQQHNGYSSSSDAEAALAEEAVQRRKNSKGEGKAVGTGRRPSAGRSVCANYTGFMEGTTDFGLLIFLWLVLLLLL